MSIFKRLFSALTESDNPVSEPVKPAEPIEKIRLKKVHTHLSVTQV